MTAIPPIARSVAATVVLVFNCSMNVFPEVQP